MNFFIRMVRFLYLNIKYVSPSLFIYLTAQVILKFVLHILLKMLYRLVISNFHFT